jgi:O-antigen biosynthesis alpha-1,3-rhamnosyltransferase
MRVVVNQLAALGRKAGIGHYTGQLLRHLNAIAQPDEVHVFPTGWIRRACRSFARARPLLAPSDTHAPSAELDEARANGRLRRAILDYLRSRGKAIVGNCFRSTCAAQDYDLYHEPNFIPFACDRPTITTVHDLSVLLHPNWHPADRVRDFERNFERAIRQTSHFLTVSDFSRQEMISTLGLSPDRVTRTYNGVRSGFRPLPAEVYKPILAELGLPPRYFLCLGTIEPRKNVMTLLRAYCALPRQIRDSCPLVLVGKWGWHAAEVADFIGKDSRTRGIIHIGYVRERHLAAVYNGARGLVYPSFYEGFGLPPLEMMACGGAVIASTAGALAETLGSQAHLVDPEDLDEWRTALMRLAGDDDWWQELRQGTRLVARSFTWSRCATETLSTYRAVLEGKVKRRPCPARLAG